MANRFAAIAVLLAAVLASVGVGVTAAPSAAVAAGFAAAWRQSAGVTVSRDVSLRDGGSTAVSRLLPGHRWAASFDVRLQRRSALAIGLGGTAGGFLLERGDGRGERLRAGTGIVDLRDRRGWRPGWRHVEVTAGARPAVDGRRVPGLPRRRGRLRFQLLRGGADVSALVLSEADRPDALLLHRLSSLRARTPPGRFPLGAGAGDRLRFARGWTSGFWPGALWQAASLAGRGSVFERWAIESTVAHLGRERADTHDLGFMYGRSSLAAYRQLCKTRAGGEAPRCERLRRSVLTAASRLLELAESNRATGTIPMSTRGAVADTIIDSVMNLGILGWASRVTGEPRFSETASRHAHTVARLLVRADGSTAQSIHTRRDDGAVVEVHSHQGIGPDSTWARGQAWAVYGFAQTALDQADPALARVAERAAGFVAARLPDGGVPRYDYDAPAGAPADVSAGVITAAGLFRIDAACRALPGACAQPSRWWRLGARMLDAALRHASRRPPLGLLGHQVYTLGGETRWDDDAELIFGLDYALEAVAARERRTHMPVMR